MRFKLIFLGWCQLLGIIGFVLWFIQRTNFQWKNTLVDQAVLPFYITRSVFAFTNPLLHHRDNYAEACAKKSKAGSRMLLHSFRREIKEHGLEKPPFGLHAIPPKQHHQHCQFL